MARLHLFGTALEIDGAAIRPPAGARFWRGSVDAAAGRGSVEGWLTVGAHACYFRFGLALAHDAAGDLRLVTGTQPRAGNELFRLWDRTFAELPDDPARLPDAGVDFHLSSGGLRMEGVRLGPSAIRAEAGGPGEAPNLVVTLPRASLIAAEALPVELSTSGGGCTLDLPAMALRFTPAAYELRTLSRLRVLDDEGNPTVVDVFGAAVPSRAGESIDLGAAGPRRELVFGPVAVDTPVRLYTDRLDPSRDAQEGNPVTAALSASECNLRVALGGVTSGGARLDGVRLEPAEGAFRLHTHTWADQGNQSAAWHVDQPLELHLRVGGEGRAASLVLAPLDGGTVAVTAAHDGPVHGVVGRARFHAAPAGALRCELRQESGVTVPAQVSHEIASELTVPSLVFHHPGDAGEAPPTRLSVPRPGDAFRLAASDTLSTLDFAGPSLHLPLIGDNWLGAFPAVRDQHLREADAALGSATHTLREARHETHLREVPLAGAASTVALGRVFHTPLGTPAPATPAPDLHAAPASLADVRESAPVAEPPFAFAAPTPAQTDDARVLLGRYRVKRVYGPVTVELDVPEGQLPDYVFFDGGAGGLTMPDIPLAGPFTASSRGMGGTGWPQALLKLSPRLSLEEIFRQGAAHLPPATEVDRVLRLIDAGIRDPGWTGVILFGCALIRSTGSGAEDGVVWDTLRPAVNALRFDFLAITPQRAPDGAERSFSYAGRVTWRNDTPPAGAPADEKDDDQEVLYRLRSVDVEWYDNALRRADINALFRFRSFLGLAQPRELEIDGALDRKTGTVRLRASLAEELPLLPAGVSGPVKQVYVRAAEIRAVHGVTALEVDGRIELQPFGFGGTDWFEAPGGIEHAIRFSGLRVRLPSGATAAGNWCAIDYPNLQLSLDLPAFRLGFLELSLRGLTVDFGRGEVPGFDWRRPVRIAGQALRKLLTLSLRLDFGKLPELAPNPLEGLKLDIHVGLGRAPGGRDFDLPNVTVGISGVSLDGLSLDLLRFLEIHAERAGLLAEDVGGRTVSWLELGDLSVRVLGHTLISGLNAYLFSVPGDASGGPQRGFLAYLPSQDPKGGILGFRWVLVGNNVEIERSLAARVMDVSYATADQNKAIATVAGRRAPAPRRLGVRGGVRLLQPVRRQVPLPGQRLLRRGHRRRRAEGVVRLRRGDLGAVREGRTPG
jgi:hypothetical protein